MTHLEGRIDKINREIAQLNSELRRLKNIEKKEKRVKTTKAGKFIITKIRKLRAEGYNRDQAIAIAYGMARHKGYKV